MGAPLNSSLIKQVTALRPKYRELGRLPKSPRFKSIQWRYQTPGSLDPFFESTRYDVKQFVDPSHPAARAATKFPGFRDEIVGVKMRPLSLLLREQRPFPAIPILTWTERVNWAKSIGIMGNPGGKSPKVPSSLPFSTHQLYPEEDYNALVIPANRVTPRGVLLDIALKKTSYRIPMSFHVSTSKKRMGQDRHMRKRIEVRLKTAVSLIVTRGAYANDFSNNMSDLSKLGRTDSDPNPRASISFSEADAGRHWVMQGWAYMFYPTSEVYNMPYPILISKVRFLLEKINNLALRLENSWLNQSLLSSHSKEKTELSTSASPNLPCKFPSDSNKGVIDQLKKPLSRPRPLSSSPSRDLAGKKLDVWKKELSSGLTLIKQNKRLDAPDIGPDVLPERP